MNSSTAEILKKGMNSELLSDNTEKAYDPKIE